MDDINGVAFAWFHAKAHITQLEPLGACQTNAMLAETPFFLHDHVNQATAHAWTMPSSVEVCWVV